MKVLNKIEDVDQVIFYCKNCRCLFRCDKGEYRIDFCFKNSERVETVSGHFWKTIKAWGGESVCPSCNAEVISSTPINIEQPIYENINY